jgi:hypothetical protein
MVYLIMLAAVGGGARKGSSYYRKESTAITGIPLPTEDPDGPLRPRVRTLGMSNAVQPAALLPPASGPGPGPSGSSGSSSSVAIQMTSMPAGRAVSAVTSSTAVRDSLGGQPRKVTSRGPSVGNIAALPGEGAV